MSYLNHQFVISQLSVRQFVRNLLEATEMMYVKCKYINWNTIHISQKMCMDPKTFAEKKTDCWQLKYFNPYT